MLSREDNELMCRVGPGTPMGNMMREYWIPAVMSSELATPDCPPMRLRLLGENLIAFRTTSGKVGIVVNACPHRGASMFFGRNEEEGLRCVYHGWKFDTTGECVDMPSEPPESNFKSKVRIGAYPVIERNNICWVYMGPRTTPPPLPELPGNTSPDCRVQKSMRDCSYMQALEGDIDTIHWGFLHAGHVQPSDCDPMSTDFFATRNRQGEMYGENFEGGATYAVVRPGTEDTDYWRMGHFMVPFYTYNAPGVLTRKFGVSAWVPLDDDHMMVWNIAAPLAPEAQGTPGVGGLTNNTMPRPGGSPGAVARQRVEDTTDWLGKFRSAQTLENDYWVDREAQRTNLLYSGIPHGAEPQDRGMQESMGPIYDRTSEHLGTTDMLVIASRRALINAAKALRDKGTVPPGVDKPELYWMFSGGALVPKGENGVEYCRDILFGKREAVAPFVGAGA